MSELSNAAEKAREWTEKRNRLIREQHLAGMSNRKIAAEVGLSHVAVAKILAK